MRNTVSIEFADFAKQAERDGAERIARIERISKRTGRRIAYGYRSCSHSRC